jgi:hypothetical protein
MGSGVGQMEWQRRDAGLGRGNAARGGSRAAGPGAGLASARLGASGDSGFTGAMTGPRACHFAVMLD